jgi:hypothetical protein
MTTSIFSMGYLALALASVAFWVVSRVRPLQVVPFGQLLSRLMKIRVNRIAIFAIWWWLGWHFFGQPFPN